MFHDTKLKKMILAQASERNRPDGSNYRSLSFRSELGIVETSGYRHSEVQIMALEQGIIPERYARSQKSLGNQEQIKLLKSTVVIVGLGGLGGGVTEILARIGVGNLILIDGDVFEDSNLNRQLLSRVEDLGKLKVNAAQERVEAINPAVETITHPVYLTEENAQSLVDTADVGVDCLDSINSRFALEAGCRAKMIPMVSAAIGGESGQATIIYPDDPGLSLIYGKKNDVADKGVEGSLGTLPYAAVTMAAIEAAAVISYLTGKEPSLRNKLLFADLSEYDFELLSLS